MTIDTAQPVGRELAAEVAERVMGLVRCRAGGHDPGDWCHAQPDSPAMGSETRRYSTDIAAAMEVVEKLNGDGLRVVLTQDWHGSWMATVWCKDEWLCASKWHESLPEAICRAALAAIGPKE